MKTIMIFLVLILLPCISWSANIGFTGNDLHSMALQFDKALENQDANVSMFEVGVYSGFVLGVSYSMNEILFCIPAGANRNQLSSIASKYIKAHPEKWDKPAVSIIADSLRKAFPCK